ncbi:Uncharacterised protein [Acinetobacter baumannii]|uniref:hypothetical protein n=1 Tax=Acinetobacter baumannii TaxID=470 RepID=UPI000DE615BF|nr:hypothetical protein [Acinetobacter baumannii]MDV7375127.1 hypothetical protein [Acinetobacter baumannii]MDV7579608.1 hypothetical protein [Acinetobacter baumannii]MEB6637035.1 hypothetical protein [Acinetobacter baumannii]SSQ09800.1 Uncharacterised protein [Acinetobacter baumannii]
MASKNFLSTLPRKIKENKGSIAICFILFIIPLFVFPTYPKNEWQYEIYQYITQIMHVTIGTKGPLPFFTILYSLYITIVMFIVGCVICYFFIRKYGINNAYQEEIYKLFFKAEFESSKKYHWLEKPLIKKTLVSSTFAGCFVMGIIHFIEDDITQQRPRRRGGLIAFSYNYRVGVMFWEIVTTVFSIFPIFYFGLLFLYIINYFFRGLGTGKVVVLEKTSNPKFRSSNK